MCWYPYPGYGQFLPYPHDDIEGGGVGIIPVEEAHMTTGYLPGVWVDVNYGSVLWEGWLHGCSLTL